MTTFKTLNRDNPCPVCSSNDGRCREAGELILCMTNPDGGAIAGWHFLGSSKDGLWGKWVPQSDRAYSEEEKREYRERQQQRERERQRLEQERAAASMPVQQRDYWYRLLLAELSLEECDRADLQRRGLTDAQIDARGYRSVAPGQRLTGRYPANLPGLKDGRVTVSGAGYLVPALTVDGAIAGFQIRLRDAESGRYRWLSNRANPAKLETGELPITVAYPAIPDPDRSGWLGFSEGILKPQIAADRLGFPVIGASGGNFGKGLAQIQDAIARLQPSKMLLLPDAGAVRNRNVMRNYRKLAGAIEGLEVLWWNQLTKESPDPDELATDDELNAIDWAEFEAIALQHQPDGILAKFKGTLAKFLAKHSPKLPQTEGFESKPLTFVGKSDIVAVDSHVEGHQLAVRHGARLIVNATGTGGQKSTFYSQVTPEFFGTERVIAVLPDALNPSVEAFYDFALLEGRHLGNIRDSEGKLRRATAETPDSEKVTLANCDKAQAIQLLAERNPHSPSFMLACSNCQHNWQCGKESGYGYGARYNSSRAFKQPLIRTGYGRLNGQGDEALIMQQAALILDESSANVQTTRKIQVKAIDISDKILQIDRSEDPALQNLKDLLHHLRDSQEWQTGNNFYGTNQAKLLPLLEPFLRNIDWAALARLEDDTEELQTFGIKTDPNLHPLTPTDQRRLKLLKKLRRLPIADHREMERLESLPKRTKEQYQKLQEYRKTALTAKLEQERDDLEARHLATRHQNLSPSEMRAKAAFLPKRWLGDFLQVLTGAPGHAHWGRDGITLTLPDQRHLSAIAAAQVVILSDASESTDKAELSKRYGIPESEIFIFRVRQPKGGTVEVVQVTGLGALGKNRGDGLELCRQALVAKFKELDPSHATFDWKKFQADGCLFRDTVGSNAYQSCQSISTTLSRPNLNVMLAEYCASTGTCVDLEDEGYKQFYQLKIKNSLIQTRGRLREQLRPGETLTFYILTDDDLPIDCDRTVAAADICPDAARKGERSLRAIIDAARKVLEQGQRLTQSAVARMTAAMGLNGGKGFSQQHVRGKNGESWERILEALQLFLEDPYKKSCSLPAERQQHVTDVIEMVEEIAATDQPTQLDEVVEWLSPPEWAIALDLMTVSARNLLLECWFSLLPDEVVEAIA